MARPNIDNDAFFLDQVQNGSIIVSKFGDVVSAKTGRKIGYKQPKGYIAIGMRDECGKVRHILVHRLVFLTFGNDKLSSDTVINHINGIKSDNRIDNLEAVSYSDNNVHAYVTGLRSVGDEQISKLSARNRGNRGELSPTSVLTERQVIEIREAYASGVFTQHELAMIYGVSRENISCITNNRTWKHTLTYKH